MLSEEQEELRRVLRSFLADTSPPGAVRRLMETEDGFDRSTWRRMAGELGLQALALPEAVGGMGFGWVELGIVFEELGRALAGGPFLATVALAAGALLAPDGGEGGDDGAAAAELLPGIAAGDTLATVAVTEDAGSWEEAGVQASAVPSGDGWTITGTKSYVLDGLVADVVLVAARQPDGGVGLFAVETTGAGAGDTGDTGGGLIRRPMPAMDLTRKLARLELHAAPARLVGDWRAVEHGLALATVALTNEQVGGAQRCLEMLVEHALTRRQFGRAIGSFQAIKHKAAGLLEEIESARSTAAYAAWAAAHETTGELLMAASLAKAACSDAYLHAASECIQVHGALGFTWEHDAHLYFKRAKSSALLFGDPVEHRSRLAGHLGI